jgi:ABC-2 type transport system ATP-binding protein
MQHGKRDVQPMTSGRDAIASGSRTDVLVAEGLQKYYGPRLALRGLSFTLKAGRLMGFLGPNGAGKTTSIRILTTIMEPDAGRFSVDGIGHEHPNEIRRRIGVLPESFGLPKQMTGIEYLTYFGQLYGRTAKDAREVGMSLLEDVGLGKRARSLVGTFSHGMRQRIGIARALVNDPVVVFLDEPTLGLDPDVSVRVRQHVAALRREQGMTIVLTTHYMREAEELCDEIGFIKAGRILARGTADALKRQIGLGHVVELKLEPRPAWLREAPGVLRCTEADGWIECTVDDPEKRVPELLRAFAKDGIEVRNLQVREPELEEVFVELAR